MKIYRCIVLAFVLFAYSQTLLAQGFVLEQVPPQADLTAATNAGQGLSLAVNANQPYLSAYSKQGHLVFVEKVDDEWVFTNVAEDVVQGVIIDDEYETSLIFLNNEPVIAFYDGTRGDLRLAKRTLGVWSIETIDDGVGDGNDVGGFPEVTILDSEAGTLRICYQDNANEDLKVADGAFGGAFSRSTVDTNGGSWCSFLDENNVLYSHSGNVQRATYADDSWSSEAVGIVGEQPTGGINSNGSTEIYSSQSKGSWGNNGVSDSQLQYYYKASGGFPSTGNDYAGAYPDFVPGTGKAFRKLTYSALFGNSSYVSANIIQSDGSYRYTISNGGTCLPVITHVQIAKAENGDIYIAYSYEVFNCFGVTKRTIQLAKKDGPEEEEDEEDEEDEEPSPPEGPGEDPELPDDDEGDDIVGNDISVSYQKSKKSLVATITASIDPDTRCILSAESSLKNNFRKVLSEKTLADISSDSVVSYQLKLKSKIRKKFFLRFALVCNDDESSKITSDSVKLVTKGRRRLRGKRANRILKKMIKKKLRQQRD